MSTVPAAHSQRLILHDVSWDRYERLLRVFDDRHLRLTYDEGTLEIMTLSHKHEGYSYLMGRFVDVLTEECELPVKAGRSTTFRRRKKQKGLEPDNCYWIANESRVRGQDRINLAVDPPPDLALETDIMHSSLNRLAIYAALRVPEVWRLTAKKLTFLVLNAQGEYDSLARSAIFPFLAPEDIFRFLQMRSTEDENAVVRAFRAWVQKKLKSQDRSNDA